MTRQVISSGGPLPGQRAKRARSEKHRPRRNPIRQNHQRQHREHVAPGHDAGEPATTLGVAERPDGHDLREQRGHERETREAQDLRSADHRDCTRLGAHRCARQAGIRSDFAKQIRPVWRAVEAPSAGTAWPASAPTCDPGAPHTEPVHPDRPRRRQRRRLGPESRSGVPTPREGPGTIPSSDDRSSRRAPRLSARIPGRRQAAGH